MITIFVRLLVLGSVAVLAAPDAAAQKLFERQLPTATGIDYRHNFDKITSLPKDSLGRLNSMVPGCGVAIGDITGDGRPDVIMSGFGGVRFYRNEGSWRFTDITQATGYSEDSLLFATGVNIVDIDGDGDKDVFVARWQNTCRLLINNGKGVFTESARAYGLDLLDESVHSVFADFDRDGLLDCYIVVYSNYYSFVMNSRRPDSVVAAESERLQREGAAMPRYKSSSGDKAQELRDMVTNMNSSELRHKGRTDRIYRNLGDGTFRDVSYEAWIDDEGMGLSATVGDINLDGWPDIYVANDFNSTDLIYLNNRDGSFAESMMKMTRRASVFSMGSDIADLTGDGLPDIITTDMLPANHVRRIMNAGNNGDMSIFNPTYDSNQVSRNMVQINRGYNQFSDVGYMTGMAATDWSWACFIQDFDLDGRNDVFVANGYSADLSNQDYIYNISSRQTDLAPKVGFLTEPNFMFRQRGTLDFEEVSHAWGIGDTSTTFGAAYGDIDGDGDLDLVAANLDTLPFVYRNMAVEQGRGAFAAFVLRGNGANTAGLGAKLRVVAGGRAQYREHYPVRGYQGCMDEKIVVGLGNATVVDSVIIEWPDGPVEIRTGIAVNTTTILDRANAQTSASSPFTLFEPERPLLVDATTTSGLAFHHSENYFDDFKRYRLMPTRLSWGGPAVAVGDVNKDGLDDVFFGDRKGKSIATFIQRTPGTFARVNVGLDGVDTTYEAQAMVLVDIDGDGDRDLVVAGGGPEFAEDEPERGLRIYKNDGKGNLARVTTGVPRISTNATTINACDIDNDGDMDIFIGGGVMTDRYPMPSPSYLLRNDGKGAFTDVTDVMLPGYRTKGIIRAALFTDYDNDGRMDLFLAGEWTPIIVLRNTGSAFTDVSSSLGLDGTNGWWYSLLGADVDNDGDMDYVAGNFGLNSRYQPAKDKPIELWSADFDDNGSLDPLLTIWWKNERHLVRERGKIFSQMPTLNRRFNEFVDFALATLDKVVDKEQLDTAYYLKATMMTSVVLVNNGSAGFSIRPLPAEAQIAPVLGIEALDLDGDDLVDLVLTGNIYGAEDDVVRYDAGKGLVLQNLGKGEFRPLTLPESGFVTPFDARGLVSVRNPGSSTAPLVLISAVNSRNALTYVPSATGLRAQAVDPKNVTSAVFTMPSGTRRVEVYCGSGYRSQTSCNMMIPPGAQSVTFYRGGRSVGSTPYKKR